MYACIFGGAANFGPFIGAAQKFGVTMKYKHNAQPNPDDQQTKVAVIA
jgi:hypothetical protein